MKKLRKFAKIILAILLIVGSAGILAGSIFRMGLVEERFFESDLLETYYPYLLIAGGSVLFYLALIPEICLATTMKKKVVIPVAILLPIGLAVFFLYNHILGCISVHKVSDGLYTMKNYLCNDTADMMKTDMRSIDDLVQWVSETDYFGIPVNVDPGNFGCCAFSTISDSNECLFGRNFDYYDCDGVLVYSKPENGYASIGMADLSILGVKEGTELSPSSVWGRTAMLAAGNLLVDGINERGVGAAILEINTEETHQETGKPDMLIYCAVRAILDNCNSVEEAVDLLRGYDIHTDLGVTYHLFITDSLGRSVVVEWLDGEMTSIDTSVCTNTVLVKGSHYGEGDADDRYSIIEQGLQEKQRAMNVTKAMNILNSAQQPEYTQWSCVYNLDKFTVHICPDKRYEGATFISAKDFE